MPDEILEIRTSQSIRQIGPMDF